MLKTDEDAVICDLAETYGVFDYRSLPLTTVATLSCGLREDSRIKTKLNGLDHKIDIYMYAQMVDALNLLVWTKTKDAMKGRNKPDSMLALLFGTDEKESTHKAYSSGAEFERARAEIIKNKKGG